MSTGRILTLLTALVASTAIAGLIQPLKNAPQILVPAAASTPGANGTFFRSDITIANFASHEQMVEIRWLPQAGTGQSVAKTITLDGSGPNSVIRSADFVHDYLAQTGLGAILVTGVDAAGAMDPNARLYVAERVWTPQPGTTGTTSQSLPTIPTTAAHTVGPAAIPAMGIPNSSGTYRTNLGIVNLDATNPQTFTLTWILESIPDKPAVVVLTVPPLSMIQGAFAPIEITSIENTTPTETRSTSWVAYGSTIDNVTGDAWSELAVDLSQ